MAGRISELTQLVGGGVADNDDLEIRDVSTGGTGTNKRITVGDLRVALKTQTIINVKNYGADGTYNPANPTSDPANIANLATNNTAFTNAWAAAKAANGILFIPVGIYGIGPGILTTTTNDAGIVGESLGNTILHFIDTTNTGTCIKQSITDATYWANTARIALPPIAGFTIDGTDAGTGSVGMRVGPAHSGYWEVRIREFKGSGGANGVTGMTGGIGFLMQNDSAFPNNFCESNVLGPRMSIQNCQNGMVVDRNGGHQSFGYNHFQFLHLRNNISHHLAIENGAYLYAGSYDIEMVTTLAQTVAAVTLEGGNSRLSGELKLNYEINHVSAVVTFLNLPDTTCIWHTRGLIDVLTSAFVLPTNTVAGQGIFHHDGTLAISPCPVGVVGWKCHSVFDPSTNLVTRVSGASNTASVFTVYGNFINTFTKGTRVAWCESGTIKYGVCSINATFSSGTSLTTVTLAPNTDYWMAASPDVGSLRYSLDNPPDFPGWFNYTPTLTGFSANPTGMVHQYKVDGTSCTITMRHTTAGTSSATGHTFTLPINSANVTNGQWSNNVIATDNGTVQAGSITIQPNAAVGNINGLLATSNNTASGSSRINSGQIVYAI